MTEGVYDVLLTDGINKSSFRMKACMTFCRSTKTHLPHVRGGRVRCGSKIQKQNSRERFTQRMNMVMRSWPSWNFIQCLFFFWGGHKFKFFFNLKNREKNIFLFLKYFLNHPFPIHGFQVGDQNLFIYNYKKKISKFFGQKNDKKIVRKKKKTHIGEDPSPQEAPHG
jgi:hypothetical protein